MISDAEAAELFRVLMAFFGGFFLSDALDGFREAYARRRAAKKRQHRARELGLSGDEKSRDAGRSDQRQDQAAPKERNNRETVEPAAPDNTNNKKGRAARR